MNPNEMIAWVQVAQILGAVGVNIVTSLKGILHSAKPDLTPEQLDAAYAAILADDAVRADFAARASQP